MQIWKQMSFHLWRSFTMSSHIKAIAIFWCRCSIECCDKFWHPYISVKFFGSEFLPTVRALALSSGFARLGWDRSIRLNLKFKIAQKRSPDWPPPLNLKIRKRWGGLDAKFNFTMPKFRLSLFQTIFINILSIKSIYAVLQESTACTGVWWIACFRDLNGRGVYSFVLVFIFHAFRVYF